MRIYMYLQGTKLTKTIHFLPSKIESLLRRTSAINKHCTFYPSRRISLSNEDTSARFQVNKDHTFYRKRIRLSNIMRTHLQGSKLTEIVYVLLSGYFSNEDIFLDPSGSFSFHCLHTITHSPTWCKIPLYIYIVPIYVRYTYLCMYYSSMYVCMYRVAQFCMTRSSDIDSDKQRRADKNGFTLLAIWWV